MQAPPVFRRFKNRLMAGGAMNFGYADKIDSVTFTLTKLFSARKTYKITSNLLNSCASIGCGGFRAFRFMKLDPVSAIGFSPIQGIVS